MDQNTTFLWILVEILHTEWLFKKAIYSDVIFMVNLGGNVSETVDLSARDSVIGVIENMVHATKNVRKASLWYVLNHENIFKAFSFLIPSANRIFWQKTTWATIMSRNDKTCIIQYFLNKKHFHLSVQCSSKSPYYSVTEFKKISDISNPILLGHLNTWNLSRNDKSTFFECGGSQTYILGVQTFPKYHIGPSLSPKVKISARKYHTIHFCQMSRNDNIQDIFWSDDFSICDKSIEYWIYSSSSRSQTSV